MQNLISPEVANKTLHWFYSHEGYDGGDFFNALMKAISKADVLNQIKLASSFPEQVAAFRLATTDPDGLEILRKAAVFDG